MIDQVAHSTGKELVTVDGDMVGSPLLMSVSGLRDGTLFDVARFVAVMGQRDITSSLLVVSHIGKN